MGVYLVALVCGSVPHAYVYVGCIYKLFDYYPNHLLMQCHNQNPTDDSALNTNTYGASIGIVMHIQRDTEHPRTQEFHGPLQLPAGADTQQVLAKLY